MVAAKSSRVNRQYKKKYRIPELEGVRAWPQEPPATSTIWLSEDAIAAWVPPKNGLRGGQRRYSNLAVRDRVDAAGRLQPAAPPDRGVPGLAAPLDEPRPQGPGPHHPLAPEPNRCGAAPDPSPRRPDRLDRRFHRAEDSGLRRMETRTSTRHQRNAGIGGSCTSGWMPRGSLWRPNSQRAAGTTPSTLPALLDTIEVSHPAFHRRRSLRPQVSLRSTQRGRYRERRDCDSPSSLPRCRRANGRPMGAA